MAKVKKCRICGTFFEPDKTDSFKYEFCSICLTSEEREETMQVFRLMNENGISPTTVFKTVEMVIADIKSRGDIDQVKNGIVIPITFTAENGKTFDLNVQHRLEPTRN